jgi:hypothetical protein
MQRSGIRGAVPGFHFVPFGLRLLAAKVDGFRAIADVD